MSTIVTLIHVITCVLLVLVVLIQSGKGAEISATLGGSSQTVFGSSGGANLFARITQVLAGVFMVTSITLTLLGNQTKKSVFEGMQANTQSAPSSLPSMAPSNAPSPVTSAAAAAPVASASPSAAGH